MEIILEKSFENLSVLPKAEYENCSFINCDFSEANFSEYKFIHCEFQQCNLSLSQLNNTLIQTTKFIDSKLLGLRFTDCNPFGLSFEFDNCNLSHADFFKLQIPKTRFKNCILHGVEFSQTDLNSSSFVNCDLKTATFHQTNLEKADLQTSYHFSIHPIDNKLKKAVFSTSNIAGLLTAFNIIIKS